MFLAITLAFIVAVSLVAAIMVPLPHWVDDGDCTRIVQHTVRVPSSIERLALWQMRYAIVREYPNV